MFGQIKIDPLDAAVSWIVRARDEWKCTRCGRQFKPPTKALHASHFHGRGNPRTRYDLENLDAHCHGCHSYFGSHPHEFELWKRNQLGEKRFEALNRRANWRTNKRPDKKLVELWLRQELPKYGLNPDDFFMKKTDPQCKSHKIKNCTICHLPIVRKPKKAPKREKGIQVV